MQFQEFQARRHFGSLDGLRCLSILAVIWHHTGGRAFPDSVLLQHGPSGVSLFFVISGFLITTLLLREKQRTADIGMKNFIVRRTLRIFPLYYTVLLVYTLLVLALEHSSPEGQGFLSNLKYYATYTSNWFVPLTDGRVIFYFAWSLATEEQFYLVWPWVEKFFRPVLAVPFMIFVVAASIYWNVLAFAAVGMGVLLAHLLDSPRGHALAWSILRWRWGAPVLLLALLGVMACPSAGDVTPLVVMALLVGAAVIREDHWLRPLLTQRIVVKIGQVSYGMYLMHMLAYNVVKKALSALGGAGIDHWALVFILTVVAAFGAAFLSYRYYESVFLRMKHRYTS
jgi:peptidoglycan/LPS O-acetylase OafA/YrhL